MIVIDGTLFDKRIGELCERTANYIDDQILDELNDHKHKARDYQELASDLTVLAKTLRAVPGNGDLGELVIRLGHPWSAEPEHVIRRSFSKTATADRIEVSIQHVDKRLKQITQALVDLSQMSGKAAGEIDYGI